MGGALKFITELKLDEKLFHYYTLMRYHFKKSNFTEKELEKVTYMPNEIMRAHIGFKNELEILKQNLHKYGFTDNQDHIPLEVEEYLTKRLKEINDEYSLEGNTGFYTQEKEEKHGLFESENSFKRFESIIKDDLNSGYNHFSDHTTYWNGDKYIEESCEGRYVITEVNVLPGEKECKLELHVSIGCTDTYVSYRESEDDEDGYSVKINDLNDASYVTWNIDSIVKEKITKKYPFTSKCIRLWF